MNDIKYYYIVENDQELGPFNIEELKSRTLRKSTLVWTEGMPEWGTAENIYELKELFIAKPPPLPERPSPPPHNPPPSQTASPQQSFALEKVFQSDSSRILAGTIGIILFSLLDWVNLSIFGYGLKFNLFSLASKLNSSFFREFLRGSEEVMLLRIVVVILLLALILSFALLIITLLKPQLKSRHTLAYCGFGLCAIVTGIFILAMIYVSARIEHWIMTIFPFLTLGVSIASMVFFVKRPEKIDLSNIAKELKAEKQQTFDKEPQTNDKEPQTKTAKRHGFVTFWLWLLIVYYFISIIFANRSPGFTWLSWLLCFFNIGFVYLLFNDKKNGFWGLCISAIIGMFVSFSNYHFNSISLVISACLGIGINYAIFQLKHNGVSFWRQLENTKIDDDIKNILAKWKK